MSPKDLIQALVQLTQQNKLIWRQSRRNIFVSETESFYLALDLETNILNMGVLVDGSLMNPVDEKSIQTDLIPVILAQVAKIEQQQFAEFTTELGLMLNGEGSEEMSEVW